jgi:hypothetical protein
MIRARADRARSIKSATVLRLWLDANSVLSNNIPHGVETILSFDVGDFARFDTIGVLHPSKL